MKYSCKVFLFSLCVLISAKASAICTVFDERDGGQPDTLRVVVNQYNNRKTCAVDDGAHLESLGFDQAISFFTPQRNGCQPLINGRNNNSCIDKITLSHVVSFNNEGIGDDQLKLRFGTYPTSLPDPALPGAKRYAYPQGTIPFLFLHADACAQFIRSHNQNGHLTLDEILAQAVCDIKEEGVVTIDVRGPNEKTLLQCPGGGEVALTNIALITDGLDKSEFFSLPTSACFRDGGSVFVCDHDPAGGLSPKEAGWCPPLVEPDPNVHLPFPPVNFPNPDSFFDRDGDGYLGTVDCNDRNAAIRPNRAENCSNDIDDNCNNTINEGCADFDHDGTDNFRDLDDDNDGSVDLNDCNPFNASIHPGATEGCNDAVDQDCDGLSGKLACEFTQDPLPDGGLAHGSFPNVDLTRDTDGDGATVATDCDDHNPSVNPTAFEIPFDLTDQDCDAVDGSCQVFVSSARSSFHPGEIVTINAFVHSEGGYEPQTVSFSLHQLLADMSLLNEGWSVPPDRFLNIKFSLGANTPAGSYTLKLNGSSQYSLPGEEGSHIVSCGEVDVPLKVVEVNTPLPNVPDPIVPPVVVPPLGDDGLGNDVVPVIPDGNGNPDGPSSSGGGSGGCSLNQQAQSPMNYGLIFMVALMGLVAMKVRLQKR